MSAARERLRAAQAHKAEAAQAVESAQKAAQAARAYLDGAERELTAHEEIERGVRAAASNQVVEAIRKGAQPSFDVGGQMDHAAGRRTVVEGRYVVASEAAEALDAELAACEGRLARAGADFDDAVKAVAAAEVELIAKEIAALEGLAQTLRVRLGGRFGATAQLPISAPTRALLTATDATAAGTANTREWRASRRHAETLREFIAALASDPDAELKFIDEEIAAQQAA